MAESLFCTRKCLSFGAAKRAFVSRVGPSSLPPPISNGGAHEGVQYSTVVIVVVAATVSALLCVCVVALVVRFSRRRPGSQLESDMRADVASAGDVRRDEGHRERPGVGKSLEDHEEAETCTARAGGGPRAEQLVVMAGEDLPTFLAHPASAAIQCPPLHL